MTKKRLLYIVSDIDKALAFEWTSLFLKSRYDLTFILIGKQSTTLEKYLNAIGVPCYVISDDEYPGHFSKWFRLMKYLRQLRPDIVHTQLWRATLLGMTASWLLRVKQRVFTRHHAAIHYNEYPTGRKWDRLCNFLATHIVAISENVKTILIQWDKADGNKIHVIHHGFDFEYFTNTDAETVNRLRSSYTLDHYPVIGVIARYLKLKGIHYVIPAFEKVLEKYPKAHLILANASGEYVSEIRPLLSTLPNNAYTEILFEKDLASLYKLFDIFVHVPIHSTVEAYGQTYVEALVAGVPSVFTLSGVAPEFIRHEYNAIVVEYKDANATAAAIVRILEDKDLRQSLVTAGRTSVQEFSLPNMLIKLEALYEGS